MCNICTTSGKAYCRTALATETSLRDRGPSNRIATMELFATLVFGLFLSSFRTTPASLVSRPLFGSLFGIPALLVAVVSPFASFEGAFIPLAYLVTTAREHYGRYHATIDTTILRRRLDFLEFIVAIVDVAKSRWEGSKGLVGNAVFEIMESYFERRMKGWDELMEAEIRDEVEEEEFGLFCLCLDEARDLEGEKELEIAVRVVAAEIELNAQLEALGKEDGRMRVPCEQTEQEKLEGIANLDPNREIEVVTEDDIYN